MVPLLCLQKIPRTLDMAGVDTFIRIIFQSLSVLICPLTNRKIYFLLFCIVLPWFPVVELRLMVPLLCLKNIFYYCFVSYLPALTNRWFPVKKIEIYTLISLLFKV